LATSLHLLNADIILSISDFFRLFAIAKPPLQLVMLRKTA
jgi:hypothetical protein